MYLKKPKASTDPRLRSLLQKAVRRGVDQVVLASIQKIIENGDETWLRSRAVVITFEESWPLAQNLVITKDRQSKENALLSVSRAIKYKDAAGLGALAFAFHEGDQSMLDIVPSKRSLRLISEGLNRPKAYFAWILSQCTSNASRNIVNVAQQYLTAATWGWDKATILAGAFLASSNGVPPILTSKLKDSDFPYWIALDKHTPEGKEALRNLSKRTGIGYRQMIWTSFYYESAIVNALEKSTWFECERYWRLRKAGLTLQEAEILWDQLRPILRNELEAKAEILRAQVEHQDCNQEKQKSML